MTKSTITRERLEELASGQSGFNLRIATLEESQQLASMALAAMDSSESIELPLDYLQGHKDGLEWAAQLAEANHPETGDWLYDDPIELAKAIRKGPDMPPAQPAADSEPVAWTWQHLKQWHVTNDEERARDLAWDGVKVEPLYRRAAMLQAGTLTNEGTKQAWTGIPDIDNAINMLDRIDTLDSCDDDRIEAVKTVLRRLAGNSPVIPDGYVMVPKEMTDEIGEAIAMQANCCGGIALDIYDAMIAAAPHDTPALNSVQSVVHVSDGWIPVSERMPPSRHEVLVGCWWGEKPRWCCKWATYIPGHPDAQSSGWLIPGASWTPTHWMPLPAAPQEVPDGK
ncbi:MULTISPECIES: DUF551 domain-containing protein [Klebsiella]|uniref:DUF551 domain-containing protein n=1 Tax=Klebsiella TaxID=570 RepID=UPI0010F73762|nr:DUF551 domain-containing protein [Klebsiella quasipneumoniae]HBT6084003.1 DUF551 domain-containing protein [Klebsiella quasipneumoniae]HBT6129194.1 DUF551 domain-containing protein [Klebsiella quasipneumoniae]HBT6223027.1 DUF551 domain-containing protein [Klebsiella quasipneumoniae]HBT6245857.1 DUF551 domain-containing protein [Klebsiella quasipneumoniae]HDG7908474.1 DUF551 domain-containing protein [Klebsiella quasipneumoniae]